MNDIWRDLLHLRADVTLAVGLVLAVGVTIHILLTKREVASAVGWIGLVWFAPIAGAVAYAVLGVNRVKRRARQLRPQDEEAAATAEASPAGSESYFDSLQRGIGRITERPLLAGTAQHVLTLTP